MLNFCNIKSKINKAYSQDLLENTNKYTDLYKEYLNTIRESPILMLEYIIHENLKKNNLDHNESLRYIDENIKAISKIDKKKILEENKKLKKFDVDIVLSEEKININQCIETIINESVFKKTTNVNLLHESVNKLIENLTTKKENKEVNKSSQINLNSLFKVLKQTLTEELSNSNFDKEELDVINTFITNKDKEKIFEHYKDNTKKTLLNETNEISEDVLNETIKYIDSLKYNDETVINDLNKLFELKNFNKN